MIHCEAVCFGGDSVGDNIQVAHVHQSYRPSLLQSMKTSILECFPCRCDSFGMQFLLIGRRVENRIAHTSIPAKGAGAALFILFVFECD